MIRLRINNIEIEAGENQTILGAAGKAGISIPTLCHKDGIEHYSSCMVCLVKDKKTGSFVPSCSATVSDGMDMTPWRDVIRLRKSVGASFLSTG
jgi:NADH dehydrogenase/NADH:ubiquinone oxidoreductase subunit G